MGESLGGCFRVCADINQRTIRMAEDILAESSSVSLGSSIIRANCFPLPKAHLNLGVHKALWVKLSPNKKLATNQVWECTSNALYYKNIFHRAHRTIRHEDQESRLGEHSDHKRVSHHESCVWDRYWEGECVLRQLLKVFHLSKRVWRSLYTQHAGQSIILII